MLHNDCSTGEIRVRGMGVPGWVGVRRCVWGGGGSRDEERRALGGRPAGLGVLGNRHFVSAEKIIDCNNANQLSFQSLSVCSFGEREREFLSVCVCVYVCVCV